MWCLDAERSSFGKGEKRVLKREKELSLELDMRDCSRLGGTRLGFLFLDVTG